jgi:hypothetical protein
MKAFNEEGEELELFSQEELDAKIAEIETKKNEEVEEAKKHLAEKTDEFVRAKNGFKQFSQLTEEEKQKMSAENQAVLQQIEELKVNQTNEREATKEAMFKAVSGGDEAVLAKIKEKYSMVNMPESTTEEINARINAVSGWAFNELGIIERKPMRIETTIMGSGSVPRSKDENDKRFSETEKGKQMEKNVFGNVLPTDNK